MTWRIPGGLFRGIAELPLADLGIPLEEEYVRMYCAATGRREIAQRDWEYYIAYNLFRLAAILQGIAKRAVDGTASNARAVESGERARPTAELGWAMVEKLERGNSRQV
jgi:aminoglycoside phosphotransferase (APT) family kinase protein